MKTNNNTKRAYSRSGVALIVVILIVLSASAIALLSLRIMHNETQATMAFKYNRQAAQAAHQAADILRIEASNPSNALTIAAESKRKAIETAYAAKDPSKGWDTLMESVKWFKSDVFKKYTGMDSTVVSDSTKNRLGGDLSLPIMQSGTVGRMTTNQKMVAGFSDGDAFCSKSMHADAYAMVGRSVGLRSNSTGKYYLLSDLRSRISGYKREMGVFEVDPIPCK